jgi:hypothetical protein
MRTLRTSLTLRASALFVGSLLVVAPSSLALAAPAAIAAPTTTRGFVRLEVPKRTAYVGESMPVTVRAYFRANTNVTIDGSPALRNSDFTLQSGDAQQGHAVLGGTTYLVVSWKDHLSPVKAGRYTLGIDVPSTLEWQDRAPRRAPSAASDGSGMGSPFGDDPFGDSLFGGGDPFAQMRQQMQRMMDDAAGDAFGPVQRKEVVLHSADAVLDVEPLPVNGRPAGFTDAVGHFAMTASAAPLRGRAGEPMSLALRVTGEGNFDRVSVSGIPESSDWKTYGTSATDGKNEKTFTEPIVPRHAGVHEIPAASFSYFDPDAKKYVTLSTAPLPVEVTPGTGAVAASNGAVPPATSGPTLAPNVEDVGVTVADLAPGFTRRGFWELQAIPVAAILAGFLAVMTKRRFAGDLGRPRRRAARRALRAHRVAMDRAMTAGDTAGFFAAARGAIQETLGLAWHIAPAAISLSEIEARLDADEVDKLRPVFDADAARFSGGAGREPDLVPWKQIVEQELEHLETLEAA